MGARNGSQKGLKNAGQASESSSRSGNAAHSVRNDALPAAILVFVATSVAHFAVVALSGFAENERRCKIKGVGRRGWLFYPSARRFLFPLIFWTLLGHLAALGGYLPRSWSRSASKILLL